MSETPLDIADSEQLFPKSLELRNLKFFNRSSPKTDTAILNTIHSVKLTPHLEKIEKSPNFALFIPLETKICVAPPQKKLICFAIIEEKWVVRAGKRTVQLSSNC